MESRSRKCCREAFHLETEERGEPLTEASIDPAIAMEACRGLDGKRGRERRRRGDGPASSGHSERERETHTHRRWIRMEEEAAGPSGSWSEVMVGGSNRCRC